MDIQQVPVTLTHMNQCPAASARSRPVPCAVAGRFQHPPGPVYRKTLGLIRPRGVRKELAALDPVKDCQRIAYLLLTHEFSTEMEAALDLAYFGSAGHKAIADMLGRSGAFATDGIKRYEDTRFLILRFMESGWDVRDGHRAIEQINKIHSHYNIKNEDFVLSLAVFVFAPIDWIENFGWRKMTPNEKEGWFQFWVQIGRLMNIQDIPTSLHAMREIVKAHAEGAHEPSRFSAEIGEATFRVFERRAGWIGRAFVRPYIRTFIPPHLVSALGLKELPAPVKGLVVAWTKLGSMTRRVFVPIPIPRLLSDMRFQTYPDGLPDVDDAGPRKIVARLRQFAAM